MKGISPGSEPVSALDLIEDAFHLVRRSPAIVLATYLVGTTPFVAGLVWFLNDMAQHPQATTRCAREAFALAVLFVWCKAWQGAFAALLREVHTRSVPVPWGWRRVVGLVLAQATLQAPALLLIPIAAFLIVPLPWSLAWFQNVTALADLSGGSLRQTAARAWRQTFLWPGQNLSLSVVFGGISLLVALNVASALLAAPLLLKMLLSIETHVSLGLGAALNATFLGVVAGLTWLCVDPLLKAAYVIRCFQGESVSTGDDLRVVFREARVSGLARSLSLVALAAGLCWNLAATAQVAPSDAAGEPAPKLDRALDDVLARPEFAWRQPPPPEPPGLEDSSAWDRWLESVRESLLALGRSLRDLGGRVLDWLEDLLRSRPPPSATGRLWFDWLATPGVLTALAILLVLGVLGWLLWAQLRRRAVPQAVAHAVPATPDVADERVAADQLPEEAWRRLADDLFRRGEGRLALRALYLGCLARLATRKVIEIARCKSNFEYVGEVRRRARAEPETVHAFERLVRAFERVWYGAHPASAEVWLEVQDDVGRIRP